MKVTPILNSYVNRNSNLTPKKADNPNFKGLMLMQKKDGKSCWLNSDMISGLSESKDGEGSNIHLYADSGISDIKIKTPIDVIAKAYRAAIQRGFSEIKE